MGTGAGGSTDTLEVRAEGSGRTQPEFGEGQRMPRDREVTETLTRGRSVVWKRNQCRSQTNNKRPRLIEYKKLGGRCLLVG